MAVEAVGAGAALASGARAAGREALRRFNANNPTKKPEAVPDNWPKIPSKKGNPKSSNPGQRENYVRWQKDGIALDINGNPVEAKSLESHIPLKKFKFKPELFK